MPSTVRLVAAKLIRSFRRQGIIGALESCAILVEEMQFDRKFGIDTLASWRDYGLPDGYERDLYVSYGPTKIRTLKKVFGELHIRYEDFIFLDIGSGKGRTLLVASEFPFRRIIGVEFSPELHSIAEKNIRAYRSTTQKCAAIESICCDATAYRMPPENTVLFLFNPFKSPIVSRLLTSLRESLERHSREVYLVYVNAFCHDLLIQSGLLQVIRVTESYAIYKTEMPAPDVLAPESAACVSTRQQSPATQLLNNRDGI